MFWANRTRSLVVPNAAARSRPQSYRAPATARWRRDASLRAAPSPLPDGLLLLENFLSKSEQARVLGVIHGAVKLGASCEPGRRIGTLHGASLAAVETLQEVFGRARQAVGAELMPLHPNAAQLNDYESGGGCALHTDARGVGASIGMFSFGSSAVMTLCEAAGTADIDGSACAHWPGTHS